MKSNLLLISDDEIVSNKLLEKLIFLRKDDNVNISLYKDAFQNVRLFGSKIILVHENYDSKKTLELISNLKSNEDYFVILVVNSYDKNLILSAYDNAVDDFILADSPSYEFVTRIVNNMKYSSIKCSADRNEKLLKQLNVVDELSGFYCYDYSKQIIENLIDGELLKDGVFMTISPYNKSTFSGERMVFSIKKSVREGDIVTLGGGAKFNLFLPKTDLNGALTVLNKIKDCYREDVCAGISDISCKTYNEFEQEALKALTDAEAVNAEYVFAEKKEETLDEWLGNDNSAPKGYKIFRQMFNKKLEKVIAPVFFRLQKVYEEKLFNTEIEQYTNEEQCVFHLKNKNNESTLRIVYPGFAKIVIYITHEGLDTPENSEIQLQLAEVTQNGLVEIIENFIKEFKS